MNGELGVWAIITHGNGVGGLLLRQQLVQLADWLPVAAHVSPKRRSEALELGHVAVV
jgi:hypothetical protein